MASSTSHRGSGGTTRAEASAARAMASARASSCWLAGALPAAASAVAAAWSAMRRRTAVSVIPGRAAAAWSRSKSATGRVMAVNTALLRAPASMPTATNRHSGSRHPARGSTSTAPAETVASTARASIPARSGGVWVAVATAATYSPSQPGRTSTGNAGTPPPIPERSGRGPAAFPRSGGGRGQLAGQVGQHGRVGVGVGQLDAQVDHPSAPGVLGDQAGVVAGVGHGGHGLDQGVQERAATHVGQLAAVVQLPEHGHRVGRLSAVGQAEHGPPDGPMGGPVEVGLLEEGGDLGQQLPRGEDRPEHGLLGLQVVRWLTIAGGHRAQAAPGRLVAGGHGWSSRRR